MGREDVLPLEASEVGERVVINVGGVKHETLRTTLLSVSGSRLARLMEEENRPSELFFDRHPEVFTHVLQFYRSGRLHCPARLCGLLMEDELAFWGISSSQIEPCCWDAFHHSRDTVKALGQIQALETETGQDAKGWQAKIWALFDKPYSSISAKVIAIVSLLFLLLSIAAFSVQTHNDNNPHHLHMANSSMGFSHIFSAEALHSVEMVCSLWFVFEFVMRLGSCPNKLRFFLDVLNVVDLLALFPWFFRWCSGIYCVRALGFLRVMRCVRVVRIFKLLEHVNGVHVLKYTLRTSAPILLTLPLLLLISTLIFGTMIYYTEFNYVDSYFRHIFDGFWWAVVTLTTVGYGDVIPVTVEGRCVFVLCAAVGLLLLILPLPVINNNFIKFNSLVNTKNSMPRKKEKSSVDVNPSSSA